MSAESSQLHDHPQPVPSGAVSGVRLYRDTMRAMSDVAASTGAEEEVIPPVGKVTVVYLGPVAPHWEVRGVWGDSQMIDGFRSRVMARLVLLPPHDPQFRRNRERVVRDAERENLDLEWDLGLPDDS